MARPDNAAERLPRILAALFGVGLAFLLLAAIPEPAKDFPPVHEFDAVTGAICRPSGPFDVKHAAPTLDPDHVRGKQAIESKDWSAAIRSLSAAALRDTRNAEVQNLLGLAYRNSGQLDLALDHYRRALRLNPRHRRAHAYMGAAHLSMSNLARAEENLAALEQICLIPCEEYDDLKKAMESYRQRSQQ